MTNKIQPPFKRDIFTSQTIPEKQQKGKRDVRQDKYAPERVRIASNQPVRANNIARTRTSRTKTPRSKNYSTKRRTSQIAGWVEGPIKEGVLQLASVNGWSQSKAVGTLVQVGLAHTLSEKHAVRLEAAIESGFNKARKKEKTTLISFLTRIAYDAAQTRIISKNILKRQSGMTADKCNEILDECAKRAKTNMTRKGPQLTELIEAVKRLIEAEEGKGS